ncbi:hypothetical protein Sjap_005839 [Stephania japonica]|uniref:Caffeoyl-CoA O-methyltransferase n=1 Tax=Stephania japonica TaxID=461633 RepID=A0AAP0K4R1_9MAGN|nr:CCoAOMT protein [Stephania japonica]
MKMRGRGSVHFAFLCSAMTMAIARHLLLLHRFSKPISMLLGLNSSFVSSCTSKVQFSPSISNIRSIAGVSTNRRDRSVRASVVSMKDEKYGKKEVVCVTPQIYDYILANVREPEILKNLREETANMRGSQMQVSPDQAQLLAMLVQIIGAQQCIEVGVFTGYSSLAIALALPESGRLIACERDGQSLEIAKKYYKQAGVSHKVDVRHALAIDTLNALILHGEADSYDFAFVDAEKKIYQEYLELLLQLVRVGGIIVFDNVLWHGKVADPLVPIGDGMTICHKK